MYFNRIFAWFLRRNEAVFTTNLCYSMKDSSAILATRNDAILTLKKIFFTCYKRDFATVKLLHCLNQNIFDSYLNLIRI